MSPHTDAGWPAAFCGEGDSEGIRGRSVGVAIPTRNQSKQPQIKGMAV